MAYNLKSIKQKFKKAGIFYTPPELTELMKSYLTVDPKEVYDPTCGDGALLGIFGDDVKKYGQEISQEQLNVAEDNLTNFTGYCGDTLRDPAFLDKKFKCIMANPPFSVEWNPINDERFVAPTIPTKSRADYAFILHILHYLAEDGEAIVLGFPGILYRGNREKTIRQWMVEKNYIDKIVHIPGDTFTDTKIATVILILRKDRKTTDITFEDRENNITRVVGLKEIVGNDYTLSVSNYIQKEIIKEEIDPTSLQAQARAHMLRRLKADIEIDKVICGLEGWDNKKYLDSIIKLTSSYKEKKQTAEDVLF